MNEKAIVGRAVTFLVITTLLSAAIFVRMFQGAEDSPAAVLFMMWTPGVAAILTSLLTKEDVRGYGWKLGSGRTLALGFVLPAVVALLAYGPVWLSGYSDFYPDEVINYRWARMIGFTTPVPFVIGFLSKLVLASLMALLGVLGEEIGWSGFLTPKLLKLFSIPKTSLLIGGYHALWHFPALIGGFYRTDTPLWAALPAFTMIALATAFLRTLLVSRSKSLWAGVIVHVSHNVVATGIFYDMTVKSEYAGYLVSETGMFLGIVYLLVAIIVWRIVERQQADSAAQLVSRA